MRAAIILPAGVLLGVAGGSAVYEFIMWTVATGLSGWQVLGLVTAICAASGLLTDWLVCRFTSVDGGDSADD